VSPIIANLNKTRTYYPKSCAQNLHMLRRNWPTDQYPWRRQPHIIATKPKRR